MTLMRFKPILAALALVVAVSGLPSVAHATTFAPMTTEMLVDASTYIVRGTVEKVWTEQDERGLIWTRAQVTVSKVMKGPDEPTSVIVDSLGGEFQGQGLLIAGAAKFSVGEEAVFFLAQGGSKRARLVPVAKYMGVHIIRRAPGEREPYTLTYQSPPKEAFDARFLPHLAPERRVYLGDLIQSIDARLVTGWTGEAIPGLSPAQLAEINAPERRSH